LPYLEIKVHLIQYINLNRDNEKEWLDFSKTLKDLSNNGIADIVEIQEPHKLSGNLITNYYQQTSKKVDKLNKGWEKLSETEQEKAITYLSQQRIREQKKLLTKTELIERESKELNAEVNPTKG
jgi:hypothetical protein